MRVAVVDCETTGLDHKTGGLVEVAGVSVELNSDGQLVGEETWFQSLVDPGMEVPPEAASVHHLTWDDVRGQPDGLTAQAEMLRTLNPDVVFAHNSAFDKAWLTGLSECRWGCTLKSARRLVPDSPRHSNQVLRYYLKLEPVVPGWAGLTPHRAAYDAAVTLSLLRHLLTLDSLEGLVSDFGRPSLLKTVGFGQHKGKLWSQVPREYLRWVLSCSGEKAFDADVVFTAKRYLGIS